MEEEHGEILNACTMQLDTGNRPGASLALEQRISNPGYMHHYWVPTLCDCMRLPAMPSRESYLFGSGFEA